VKNKTISALIIFFGLLQTITIMASQRTEEQKYSVVFSTVNFEIRLYPEATMATVYSDARTYKELAGPGFRKLAGYIFGGNESDTRINMTAPVHMDINDSLSAMSFVMPSGYNEQNLPRPDDSGVIISKTSDEFVAVIQFSGFASDHDIHFYSDKLKRLLTENNISYYGHFRFLGYNPPYRLFGRRNEIAVSVNWENK